MKTQKKILKFSKHRKIKRNLKKQTAKKHTAKKYSKKQTLRRYSKKKTLRRYNLKGGVNPIIQNLVKIINGVDEVLQIDISIFNPTIALACICKNKFFYDQTCNNIRSYSMENLSKTKITLNEENTAGTDTLYVWVFSGTQFKFMNPNGTINYSISVEYDECFNFDLAKTIYFTVEENTSGIKTWGLNECGRLVFNCLLKYTSSFDMRPDIISNVYNKEENSFVIGEDNFIKCMNSTNLIFGRCSLFYAGVAGNTLKELFKYANPIMTIDDVRDRGDMEEAAILSAELKSRKDEFMSDELENQMEITPAHDLTDGNEHEYRYDMIETELNALVLEASIGTDLVLGHVNIRRILNMFIIILNLYLQGRGVCAKSGGEVFRYFGELSAYTNDIDTKIFYSESLTQDNIMEFQLIMLRKLIAITIYLTKSKCIFNIKPNTRDFQLGNLEFNIEFVPFLQLFRDNVFDSRVRSKLVAGHRLFSLDVYLGAIIKITKLDRSEHQFPTYYTASPFDGCNYEPQPAYYYTDGEMQAVVVTSFEDIVSSSIIIETHLSARLAEPAPPLTKIRFDTGSAAVQPQLPGMPIMSKEYLLLDILFLLSNEARLNKRNKDLNRLVFLLGLSNIDKAKEIVSDMDKKRIDKTNIVAVNEYLVSIGIEFNTLLADNMVAALNAGSEHALVFNERLDTFISSYRQYIDGQLERFIPTINFSVTPEGKTIISDTDYKTSTRNVPVDYDNMDYN